MLHTSVETLDRLKGKVILANWNSSFSENNSGLKILLTILHKSVECLFCFVLFFFLAALNFCSTEYCETPLYVHPLSIVICATLPTTSSKTIRGKDISMTCRGKVKGRCFEGSKEPRKTKVDC